MTLDNSLADSLRTATADAHREVERAALLRSIFEPGFGRDDYVVVLSGWRTFFESFDGAFSGFAADGYRYLPRLSMVERDLRFLLDAEMEPPLQYAYAGWRPETRSECLGAAYVIEGSTLGARVICKRLFEQLGPEARHCTAFYSMRTVHWPDFRSLLNEAAARQWVDRDEVVAAALRVFDSLSTHMDQALPPSRSVVKHRQPTERYAFVD